MSKTFIGARLRRLRAERDISQAGLARHIGLSTSYVNQLENDQRPATVPVLLKLTSTFDVDMHYFAADSDGRLVAELTQVFHERPELGQPSDADLAELVARMPSMGRALVSLSRNEVRPNAAAPTPFEQVRDFFYDRDNHIAELDAAAEALFDDAGLKVGDLDRQLAAVLASRHDVRVSIVPALPNSSQLRRRFDPATRVLSLSRGLLPGQRAFELATQLAYLG